MRNSPEPPSGTRWTICRPVGSRNSITSSMAMLVLLLPHPGLQCGQFLVDFHVALVGVEHVYGLAAHVTVELGLGAGAGLRHADAVFHAGKVAAIVGHVEVGHGAGHLLLGLGTMVPGDEGVAVA